MDKQTKFKLALGLGAGVLICAFSSLIFLLLKTTAALVTAGALGTAAFIFAPVFIHQLTVWKFSSLKAIVSRDPINNLIALQKKRHAEIEEGRLHLEDQTVAASEYKRNCDNMIKKYPEKTEELRERQKVFEDMLAYRVDQYAEARLNYNRAEEQLDYLEMEYDNAVAAYKAGKAFGTGADFFDKLIEKTAIKAIGAQVDRSVAQMRMAMVDANVEKMIAGKTQHQVTYDAAGNVVLGNILEPLKVRA